MNPDWTVNAYEALRPLLFRLTDAEQAHNAAVWAGRQATGHPALLGLLDRLYNSHDGVLHTDFLGMHFRSPVGLAAGFDKNYVLTDLTPHLGFGFHEGGSTTARAGKGNDGERLWRLPEDRAIINRMGLNNCGADAAYEGLKPKEHAIPVGVNIAKTHDPKIMGDGAIEDFCYSFRRMYPVADYIVLNISCPNTGDGRTFEDPVALAELLSAINQCRMDCGNEYHNRTPALLKVSPDLDFPAFDDVIGVSEDYGINGHVIGNTTKDRGGLKTGPEQLARMQGGLSGPQLKGKSLEMIRHAYRHINEPNIIGVGGIFTPEDAVEKILAGASAVEVLTGMVYEGPGFPSYLNRGIAKALRRRSFNSVNDAVGQEIYFHTLSLIHI